MTTLLLGGRIHSPIRPDATAMAVDDDIVIWLGSDDVARSRFPDADAIDLDGAFVAPAFVDSHVHVTPTGLTRTGLDLGSADSKHTFLSLLAGYAAAHAAGVIWGQGWDESRWPSGDAPPTTAEIDAVIGRRPAYLARVDVHSALASTALRDRAAGLESAAGYDGPGALTAEAHHRVRAAARELLTVAQRAAARAAALDAFAACGVVAVHECAGPDIGGHEDWCELREFEHGVEVIGYWGEAVSIAAEAHALIGQTGVRGLAGDLFVDGALGSRTARLNHPYADAPDCRGNRYLDVEDIRAHLQACTEAGVAAGFHVIGDAAIGAVVEAFERVIEACGVTAVARCGHRLEHLEMVSAEQAARLGGWGVIASVQPNFDALWGGPTGMYALRLGAERAERLNPLALLTSEGVPLAFGSDSPVSDIDPWATIRAAVNHHTPGSALGASAAFAASTRGGWRAAGLGDGVTGTLVPGATASYAVWDAGPVDAAPVDGMRRWSTDTPSRLPPLPRLGPGATSPRCLQAVHRGVVVYGGQR